MKAIFLDNYRGFTGAYIPLRDVNFLVGENSTGKTSFMKAFQLLSSSVIQSSAINKEMSDLGDFKDLVSLQAVDRTRFSMGLLNEMTQSNSSALLFTFKERHGAPCVSKFTYSSAGITIHLIIGARKIQYRHEELKSMDSSVFQKWATLHSQGNRGFMTLPYNFSEEMDLPVLFAMSLVSEKVSANTKIKADLFSNFLMSARESVTWIAPVRSKPRRTYDKYGPDFSSDGEHIPYVIRKKLYGSKSSAEKFLNTIREIGKSSGLFESIKVRKYGRSHASPFELKIVLNKKDLNIENVGYGVSQALPVIVELMIRPEKTWFAVQQPEVHLHPRAQAALGNIFFELATRESKKLIIETHSDYTIDRFKLACKETRDEVLTSQILYFERGDKGNSIFPLEIDKNGEIAGPQPDGYRRFFLNEEMKILGF